jgi:hemolysin type calcium-binding protein
MRLLATFAAALTALIATGSAEAAVTATYNGGNARIDVALTAPGDVATVVVVPGGGAGSPQIHVNGFWPPGAAVDSTQHINFNPTVPGTVAVIDLRGGPFAPGILPSPSPEISFDLNAPAGQNELRIISGDAPQTFALGSNGINLNAEETAEIDADVFLTRYSLVTIETGLGADSIRAIGGAETGTMPFALPLHVASGGGNDLVQGGSADDLLDGGLGDDQVTGEAGNDVLTGGLGMDALVGNDGNDTVASRDGVVDAVDCGLGMDALDADLADLRAGCETPLLFGAPVLGTTVKTRWRIPGTKTRVMELTAKNVPAGASSRLSCAGSTCPFHLKTKAYATAMPAVAFAGLFGTRKLKAGTVIELRITAPGFAGRVFRWELRKRKLPKASAQCLAPGSTRPVACP